MTADPTGAAPMEGHGSYNRSSGVQAAGASPALPSLERAARKIPLAAGPIVIADYGAAEGRNSLAPMRAAIATLRERAGKDIPISVVHIDQPGNDFSVLFQTLESDPASYLRDDPAAFASAVGRSFYRQVLPAGSVILGWSAWAVQWLSRAPGPIPDHVQVACSRDPAAREAYTRQAAEDWRRFVAHRGTELRPGGQLVVLTMGLTEAGSFGYAALLAAMCDSLDALVAEGFVHAEEARRMAIPTVGRGRADLLAPFAADGNFAGLSVEDVQVFLGEDDIWRDYERDGDAASFGARWAAFTRASVLPTLALGLDGGSADPRRDGFVERMEAGMRVRLAARPEPTEIPLATIVLRKGDGSSGRHSAAIG